MTELESRIEAVLFALGEAVSVERLTAVVDATADQVAIALSTLTDKYDFENHGIMLCRMGDKVQLCSRPVHAPAIRRALETRRPPSLSAAALEVLTVVAYRQPVTRAYIEQLRGVDSGGTISGLVEKGLIEEVGRLDVPGRPVVFGTTDTFLRTFGITSLKQLPDLPELVEGEQMTMQLDKEG